MNKKEAIDYIKTEDVLIDTNLILYGILTNVGGKTNPNLHLDTEEYGTLTITAKENR